MVDKASGNLPPNQPINNQINDVKADSVGEKDNQSVTSHSPKESKLDRRPSQTAQRSLKDRTVSHYQQTQSIQQGYDISTVRRLALTNQWPGVISAMKLHVSSEAQLSQLLHELGSEVNFPSEVQDAICDEFSTHCAARTAGILISNLSDDPKEAHGSLLLIIDRPERHDSPIGFLSRQSSKEFVAEHNFEDADMPMLVRNTTERTFDKVAANVDLLEEHLLRSTNQQEAKAILNSRTERKIEMDHRREHWSNSISATG